STARTVVTQVGPPPFRGIASIRTAGGWRAGRNVLDDPRRRGEDLEVARRKLVEEHGERADTSLAPPQEDRAALWGRRYDDRAAVVGVASSHREAVALERGHEPAHGRCAHLLGTGEG